MSLKCLNCGYKMSTYQEFTTFLSSLVRACFRNLKEIFLLARIIKDLIGAFTFGYAAGPLNVMEIRCPKRGEPGRWEDG